MCLRINPFGPGSYDNSRNDDVVDLHRLFCCSLFLSLVIVLFCFSKYFNSQKSEYPTSQSRSMFY